MDWLTKPRYVKSSEVFCFGSAGQAVFYTDPHKTPK